MKITTEQIEEFLIKVDRSFPIPLSQKQNLHEFAQKLSEKATICARTEGGAIVSAVFGYTENVEHNRAYISVVATLPEARGKGYASELVRSFIGIAEEKGLDGVHLYAFPSNVGAIAMYERIGFRKVTLPDEPRPHDAHLVYSITK